MPEFRVASVDELSQEKLRVVEVEGLEIGLLLAGDKVHAFENRCAHQGGPVCYGEVLPKVEAVLDGHQQVVCERFSETELHLVCPWHGWEYDIETGLNAADPRWGIRKFETRVHEREVYVRID